MAQLLHLYQPGKSYLLTSVTHRREPLFEHPEYAWVAHKDIGFYTGKFKMVSLAHVIMPDHIHWVIYPSPEDYKRFTRDEQKKPGKYAKTPERFYLSKIMEDYKRHVSFVINQMRGTQGAQCWQDGFRDDGLHTLEAISLAVNYVVYNPVKAGLVVRPEDYAYLAWDAAWLV